MGALRSAGAVPLSPSRVSAEPPPPAKVLHHASGVRHPELMIACG